MYLSFAADNTLSMKRDNRFKYILEVLVDVVLAKDCISSKSDDSKLQVRQGLFN